MSIRHEIQNKYIQHSLPECFEPELKASGVFDSKYIRSVTTQVIAESLRCRTVDADACATNDGTFGDKIFRHKCFIYRAVNDRRVKEASVRTFRSLRLHRVLQAK